VRSESSTHSRGGFVYRWKTMRTNIEIDDELLAEAQRVAGTATKRATVHYALEELVRRKERRAVLELRGTVDWEGDLEESRNSRVQ
jgi:Arc/MetJ family transcription regulator